MKRAASIALAKVAGYHGDSAAFTRLVIESRASRSVMVAAYRDGADAKKRGVKCECAPCSEATQ